MSVAKSYARALFETSKDPKNLEELSSFQAAIDSSKDLRVALLSPATSSKEKLSLVDAIGQKLGVSKTTGQFLNLLAKRERLALLPKILGAFAKVSVEAEGGVMGELISAEPMTPADVKSLSNAFKEKLGKPVTFQTAIDPNVLAGVKVLVNGVTYDGTLRAQLQRLRDRLVSGSGVQH
ncbi:ATP synthase F1 subunit delta [bacterium]|nr:ATP synthase F1 subunit delta [bacterium]